MRGGSVLVVGDGLAGLVTEILGRPCREGLSSRLAGIRGIDFQLAEV